MILATNFLTHCSSLYYCMKYGKKSEVWGAYDKLNLDKWEQDPVERFHCQFYKCFLGLNKRASNVVARNEVGKTSLKPTIYLNILKFWEHSEELPENSIAKQCLIISKKKISKYRKSFLYLFPHTKYTNSFAKKEQTQQDLMIFDK